MFGVPRSGLFAALTCLTAASSPAIYFGTGAEGLSYLVALVAVPAVAAVGVARNGRRSPRREDRPLTARHRVSYLLAGAALPAALAVDVAIKRAVVNGDDLFTLVSVVYGRLLVLGLLGLVVLRPLTSTRAVFAVLGVTAVPIGASLLFGGLGIGLVLAATPLLLSAAVAYPPVLARKG